MKAREEVNEMSDEDRLAERAKALFDESVRELDGETLSRLNRSRCRALDEARRGGAGRTWRGPVPAALAASVAVVAAVVVWRVGTGVDALPPATASDIEFLLAGEELEMLEGLEFYRWMALEETKRETGADEHVG